MTQSRELTYDEKRASEAAFRGLPMEESWTASAKAIYEGIIQTLNKTPLNLPLPSDITEEPVETSEIQTSGTSSAETPSPINAEKLPAEFESLSLQSRRDAIQSGILKDVTHIAQNVGLDFCVGMTNPLWDQYISSSPDFTEELIQNRLRDTMVALRLRLASLKTPTPLVDVPVLLQFPPEPTPQLCLAFALFHKDPLDGDCLLLIHPGEVFATRQSFENN